MIVGGIWVDLDCLIEEVFRVAGISCLVRERAEEEKGVGIFGVGRQDLAIDFLCFAEPVGAVMGQGRFQLVLRGHLHHVSHI